MPDESNCIDFGGLADGGKTSDEIFNAKCGTYKENIPEPTNDNPAASLDPSPFTISGGE